MTVLKPYLLHFFILDMKLPSEHKEIITISNCTIYITRLGMLIFPYHFILLFFVCSMFYIL